MGIEVEIVDPATHRVCAANRVGEIWIRSPGVASGYWGRPAESAETFRARIADTGDGPWLRTGDLGFLREGCIFVTGRLKDLIICGGRNIYPQDLEYTAEQAHEAVRPNASAAFGLELDGATAVGIAVEIKRLAVGDKARQQEWFGKIARTILSALTEGHEVSVAAVMLVPPGTLPKTSSGKIQRSRSRAAFLERAWIPQHLWTHPRWSFPDIAVPNENGLPSED